MEYDPTHEYIEVHQRRLRMLANKVDRLVDESVHSQTIVQTQEGAELEITQSPILPENFLGDGASLEDAEALADMHNNNLLAAANLSINSLLTSVSLKHTATAAAAGDLDEASQTDRDLLHYNSAEFSRLVQDFDSRHVILSRVRLEGVEHFGQVEAYDIYAADEELVKILTIQFATAEPINVKFVIGPRNDELLFEGIMLLGIEKFSKLIPVLSGRFKSEDNLDETLGEMWLDFQGTSKEGEMLPFLDKVRLRAMAARDNTRFNISHNVDLPTADQLEELESLFGK